MYILDNYDIPCENKLITCIQFRAKSDKLIKGYEQKRLLIKNMIARGIKRGWTICRRNNKRHPSHKRSMFTGYDDKHSFKKYYSWKDMSRFYDILQKLDTPYKKLSI